jgi:hypothetical protein
MTFVLRSQFRAKARSFGKSSRHANDRLEFANPRTDASQFVSFKNEPDACPDQVSRVHSQSGRSHLLAPPYGISEIHTLWQVAHN